MNVKRKPALWHHILLYLKVFIKGLCFSPTSGFLNHANILMVQQFKNTTTNGFNYNFLKPFKTKINKYTIPLLEHMLGGVLWSLRSNQEPSFWSRSAVFSVPCRFSSLFAYFWRLLLMCHPVWTFHCHLSHSHPARYQKHFVTRASARRGMNTPGRCHFLMYENNLGLTMIYGKINGPWNIGHWPTYSLQGRSFESQWSIIPSTMFLHQIVFKIWSKITGP